MQEMSRVIRCWDSKAARAKSPDEPQYTMFLDLPEVQAWQKLSYLATRLAEEANFKEQFNCSQSELAFFNPGCERSLPMKALIADEAFQLDACKVLPPRTCSHSGHGREVCGAMGQLRKRECTMHCKTEYRCHLHHETGSCVGSLNSCASSNVSSNASYKRAVTEGFEAVLVARRDDVSRSLARLLRYCLKNKRDAHGWINLNVVLTELRKKARFKNLTDLEQVVTELLATDRLRFERKANMVRAALPPPSIWDRGEDVFSECRPDIQSPRQQIAWKPGDIDIAAGRDLKAVRLVRLGWFPADDRIGTVIAKMQQTTILEAYDGLEFFDPWQGWNQLGYLQAQAGERIVALSDPQPGLQQNRFPWYIYAGVLDGEGWLPHETRFEQLNITEASGSSECHVDVKCIPSFHVGQKIKTIHAYDGVEKAESIIPQKEAGYLAVGSQHEEMLTVLSPAAIGHSKNRFEVYIFACREGNERDRGWIPASVVRAI